MRQPSAIEPPRGGLSVGEQALQAQTALLPYALAAFGICLPAYVWAGSHAPNAAWMSVSFVIFAIGWGAFYAVVNWLKQPQAADPRRRARVQLMGGLIWAAAIAQIAAFAEGAGPFREPLLLAALGAAVVCVVFTAPWLPSLLIVAPAALAGPLVGLFSRSESREVAQISWGAVALALALGLVVNRILRRQFALAAEREVLMADRAEQAEAARRLARSKSDLVATLGDEIRNGLTGVAHVLAAASGRGGRAAPSRAQLSAALDAANDLLSVLETTLDAETAEAGRLTVRPQPVDVVGLVRDLALLARPQAAAKGLELRVHVAPELAATSGAAVADPVRSRQVLAGLIGNAVKFTVRGRVEVRVALNEAGRLAVEIVDTGPGLTEDELAVAFEPFQRVARTSAGTTGAGLGLTLSRQLARLMGGELRAHSALGVGSCFTLELPFDRHATAAPPLEAGPEKTERRRLRVLLAEDEALNAAMLRAHLEQLGHQVVHAASGQRAIELARVCDLDLMMIDARMPGLDGHETIGALRAMDGHAALTPIVALIGGDPEEARDCLAAGADALLRKPVTVPAVARAIAEALASDPAANDRVVA
ncbi:ATP-binding protein [Phenylobacterium sp.]|uniref:ATP-binding protein n=1 Tax=Phenylobacterium sp. TaxID=1871053 RepID=UPI002FE0B29C